MNADPRLHDAARGHAQDRSLHNFVGHTGSDGSTPGTRITAVGYRWRVAAENIAYGQGRVYDPLTRAIAETSALDAARQVMFGTYILGALSAFDQSRGGAGFGDWSQVGAGWTNAVWDAWGDGWMGSSGHRANILSTQLTDIGVGYVFEAGDTFTPPGFPGPVQTYWTQAFAAGDSLAAVPLPASFWLLASALALARPRRRPHVMSGPRRGVPATARA